MKRIFDLPPIEQRNFWPALLAPGMNKEQPDTYIYYLALKWSLIVGFFLSFLNWISYVYQIRFDFILFEISLPSKNFVREFSWSYTLSTGLILLVPLNWFFYQKIKWNVDIKTFDSLWWNKKLDTTKYRKILWLFRFFFVMSFFCISLSGCFGEAFLRNGNNHSSYNVLLFLLLTYPVLITSISHWALVCMVVIKNYKARLKQRNNFKQENEE